MSEFTESLRLKIKKNFNNNQSVLVATSGGVDSMVLCDVVLSFREELKLNMSIAHIDHKLREGSFEDAKFVAKYAKSHDMKFFLHEAKNVPNKNIESWGRKERYSFFSKIQKENDFDLILTAHNASDVAETLLMKLMSNRELNCIAKLDERRSLMRPLLSLYKKDILLYAKELDLEYREDSSNTNIEFLRNKYRHDIIPYLSKSLGCDVEPILCNQSLVIEEEKAFVNRKVENLYEELSLLERFSSDWLRFVKGVNDRGDYVLAWKLVESSLLDHLGYKVGVRASKRVLEVITRQCYGAQVPGGYEIRPYKGGLKLEKI